MADRDISGLMILNVEADRYPPEALALLRDIGQVDLVLARDQTSFRAALSARPYDALMFRLGLALTTREMDAAPKLRYVVTPTTGLDHIDLADATARGIEVISLLGDTEFLRTIASTAEHTWALILSLVRGLPAASADVTAGRWSPTAYACGELAGATLGVAGFGRLGRMVAAFGTGFGMRVVACDRDPSRIAGAGVEGLDAESLVATADVLSLHLPLTPETSGWLSRERIASMRPGAFVVNTARGELIDEIALLDALRSGAIAGAALDVLAGDPRWDGYVPPGHPLLAYAAQHANLLVTPHIGGAGVRSVARARQRVSELFADAVRNRGGGVPA